MLSSLTRYACDNVLLYPNTDPDRASASQTARSSELRSDTSKPPTAVMASRRTITLEVPMKFPRISSITSSGPLIVDSPATEDSTSLRWKLG